MDLDPYQLNNTMLSIAETDTEWVSHTQDMLTQFMACSGGIECNVLRISGSRPDTLPIKLEQITASVDDQQRQPAVTVMIVGLGGFLVILCGVFVIFSMRQRQ